ncbi:hypothetical protein [Candidatus Methanomassiliicoccus intestinalis]|uniref:hypothetical protein n=1 Tax=Candidatus Methanomassiliicoccus intestinalis TaxID=1406512 RepID=UPI0037DD42E5
MDFEPMDNASYDGWKFFIVCGEGTIFPKNVTRELCLNKIPNGSKLYDVLYSYASFSLISMERPAYRKEDTLRLILPFLRSYGLSNTSLKQYFKTNLNLTPGSRRTMRFAQEITLPFLISSLYEHYVCEACEVVDIPVENTYSMSLDLDYWDISKDEESTVKKLGDEIASMPIINRPSDESTMDDISETDKNTLSRLDEIFEDELIGLQSFRLLSSSSPLGGEEKASSFLDIRRKTALNADDVMLVCSSDSDSLLAHMIREAGGLVVAFNATPLTLISSDIAVVSEDTTILSFLADVFQSSGKGHVEELVEDWSTEAIRESPANKYLINDLLKSSALSAPLVTNVNHKTPMLDLNERFLQ